LRRDFLTHFKATTQNCRTESEANIRRAGLVNLCHFFQRPGQNASHSSSPPGVNRRNCTILPIHQQDRNTVGSSDRHEQAGAVGDQSVTLAGYAGLVRLKDDSGMHLSGGGAGGGFRPDSIVSRSKSVLDERDFCEHGGKQERQTSVYVGIRRTMGT
jgi:hypothetical protein